MRYVRKHNTSGPDGLRLILPNGHSVNFKTVDGGANGYQAFTDQNVINALVSMIEGQSGGLTEVSCEEFQKEFLGKKNRGEVQPLRVYSREELSSQGLLGAMAQAKLGGAVAVANQPITHDAQGPVVIAPLPKASPVAPKIGRRGKT